MLSSAPANTLLLSTARPRFAAAGKLFLAGLTVCVIGASGTFSLLSLEAAVEAFGTKPSLERTSSGSARFGSGARGAIQSKSRKRADCRPEAEIPN